VYALINALSRYSDEERSTIDSIEKLHALHQKKNFEIKYIILIRDEFLLLKNREI